MGKQGKKTNMRKKGYKSEPSKKGKVSCLFIYICKNKGVNKRKHNPIQKVIVKKVLQPVRVIGYKFDIRSLQAKRDKIQIFGFDGKQIKPVLTDSKGRVKVVQENPLPSRIFHEEKFLNMKTKEDWIVLKPQITSTQVTYSYAVINKGDYPALIRIEVSPNSIDFAIDQEEVVNPNATIVMVPTRFLRYTRVSVRSKQWDNQTNLDIYFQSQSVG